jgi:hypothetical protein
MHERLSCQTTHHCYYCHHYFLSVYTTTVTTAAGADVADCCSDAWRALRGVMRGERFHYEPIAARRRRSDGDDRLNSNGSNSNGTGDRDDGSKDIEAVSSTY